jgi:hypothetical protein
MSGGAALAKPLKQFKQTWQTTFPEQHEAADALVDAWTEKWTVAKLKTLNKTEKTRRHLELVASVDKVLPDEWKTSELKRENFTAADSFVENALSRWRRKNGQGACYTSKHAKVGGIRHDETARQTEQRRMFKAGTIVADPEFAYRVSQVCLLVCNFSDSIRMYLYLMTPDDTHTHTHTLPACIAGESRSRSGTSQGHWAVCATGIEHQTILGTGRAQKGERGW